MEYNVFTKKLYDMHKKDNQSKEVNNKMYGEILANIFCDVEKYEDAFHGMVNVSENFDGKYKTLGEYFSKSENNGIDIVTTTCVITNIQYKFH